MTQAETQAQATIDFKQTRAIYLLFALGAIACFISTGGLALLGMFAITAGIIMAYYRRKRAANDLYRTHNTWQIRTFWIGNIVAFPLAMIAYFIVIYLATDMSALISQASSGAYGMDVTRIEADFIAFEKENMVMLVLIKWATYGLALLWWLQRCYTGYKLLQKNAPVPQTANPPAQSPFTDSE